MSQKITINLAQFIKQKKREKEERLARSYEEWHRLINMKLKNQPVDIRSILNKAPSKPMAVQRNQSRARSPQPEPSQVSPRPPPSVQQSDILKEILNIKQKLQVQNLFEEISEESESQA